MEKDNKLKTIWAKIRWFLGLERHNEYVNNHVVEADARSGIYMSAVIVLIEIWMIVRRLVEDFIPDVQSGKTEAGLLSFLKYTSFFWLFFFSSLTILFFCITYKAKRMRPKTKFLLLLIPASIAFVYCFHVFNETYLNYQNPTKSEFANNRNLIANIMTIALYSTAFVLSGSIIAYSIFQFVKKQKPKNMITLVIIMLFAIMCFVFGVKVSYSDHTSSDHKEIICFLTMGVYVACLLVWHPWASLIINPALFVGFYLMVSYADKNPDVDANLYFKDGDLVNYITFLISLTMVTISIYHQRLSEAIKDEGLEHFANYDDLTGLNNFSKFVREAQQTVNVPGYQKGNHALLFLNVVNFKAYNDRRGFPQGNLFLKRIGEAINGIFPGDLVCRQSDDHFMILTHPEGVEEKVESLNQVVRAMDEDLKMEIKVGGYLMHYREDIRAASDKPRYAVSQIHNEHNRSYLLYDSKMHEEFHLMQYIIQNIDNAVEKGYIKPYYQPVVWSKDQELCGVEALARWEDPERGLLPPYAFVPTLENTKLIHKLDAAIIVAVCKDIRHCLDAKLPVVPVSINFSRLDFELMDAVKVLEDAVATYNIPKEYLHVEITESALSENATLLVEAVNKLKKAGYALWLDDFGSGYSSLNALKDFDFDVMKIDLVFLRGFENNPKVKPILESVIDMAKRLGMRTLAEGVESPQQREFLSSAGCERLQGYLYGKPIPFAELQERIEKKELKVSKTALK